MKTIDVTIQFQVRGPDGEEISDNEAWAAADLAHWNNLALMLESTRGGEVESVDVHVDGCGLCKVTLVHPGGGR